MYDPEELEKEAVEAIRKNNLFNVTEVWVYMSIRSKQTFYNYNLDKLDSVKEALSENKIKIKNGLRAKWYHGNAPATQIALYKLISDDDELKKLNSQYVDHTSKGEKIEPPPIVFYKPDTSEFEEWDGDTD